MAESSRKNITALADLRDCGHIDVCRLGTTVHLHCHTTEGRVILRMQERAFVRDCRAPRDSNGQPLRNWADLDDAAQQHHERKILAHQISTDQLPAERKPSRRRGHKLSPERLAAYERILQVRQEQAGRRSSAVRLACEAEGITYRAFTSWYHGRREKQ